MFDPIAEPRFVPYRPPRLGPGEGLSALDHDGALARARRSVRSFSPEPVPRALIERALEIAGTAPSGAHRQPWHFVAIADPRLKRRLREAAEIEEREFYEKRAPAEWLAALAPLGTDFHKEYLEVAPWLIVVFRRDPELLADGRRLKNYHVQESVGIAVGFLIQALHRAGLATLTHTPSPMTFLRELCGRPANEKPFVLMPVGYPAADCTVPDLVRKPLFGISTFLALAALILVACLAPAPAGAWGGLGHRSIASQYGESLPPGLEPLRAEDAWVTDHVLDADVRKSTVPAERYRHYIDIDAYPEYAVGTLPHDRATLEARYGAAQVEQWGVAPWAIGEVVDSLETAMRAGDWARVRFWIADLCHYVGDLHQPLHCTLNYDGQFTGNQGIHYRYETRMLDLNAQALQLDAGTVTWLSDPVDAAFAIAGVSEQNTGVVLDADTQARAAAGGSTTSGAYYAGLWSRTSELTLARLGGASVGTASFVYTAWVNAGFPAVPGGAVDAESPGMGSSLALTAGPTPARDALTLRYTLPRAAAPVFELVDARGRRVARIDAAAQPAGAGRFTWPLPRDVAAGVYFVRLVLADRAAEARVVVAR